MIETWIGRSLCAMALVIPFLWDGSLLDASALPRHVLIEVGGAMLMTALLFSFWRRSGPDAIRIPLLAWPVLGFFMMTVASNGWAHHQGSALIDTVHLSGMILLFALALYASAVRASFPLLLLRVSVLAGAGIAYIGLLQNFGWMEHVFFQAAPPAATMINKNVCAQYMDTLLFPAWMLVMMARNNREAWQWSAAFCLILAMILTSYTRGAWLGLLVGLIVLAVYMAMHRMARQDMAQLFSRAKGMATAVAIIIACVIMVMPSAINKGTMASKWQDTWQHPEGGSASVRLVVNANTWQMLKDHPLGTGIGNWKHAYPKYSRAVYATPDFGPHKHIANMHNDPFVFFAELGWIGGLFFISIFAVLAWIVWKISAAAMLDRQERLLALSLLLALADVGAHALVSFPFHMPTSSMQIWLWLGLVGGIALRSGADKSKGLFPMTKARWGGLALLGGLGVLLLVLYNLSFLESNRLLWVSYIEQGAGKVDCKRMDELDAVKKRFPHDYRIMRSVASVHYACNKDRLHAFDILHEEIEQEPYLINELIDMMPLAAEIGRWDIMDEVSQRLVDVFPYYPDGYHGRGLLAFRKGDDQQAAAWFQQALQRNPDYMPSRKMLEKVRGAQAH